MPAHAAPSPARRRTTLLVLAGLTVAGLGAAWSASREDGDLDRASTAPDTSAPTEAGDGDGTTSTPTTDPEADAPASGWAIEGLLTFRGSATRSYYGTGPMPEAPEVLWSYPGESGGMCGESTVAGETTTWCGTGWTGQPAVFERDGRTWVVFGAYDHHVHFVDYDTGEDILPPFPTGDIIKGSVTVDPDGYPLVYSGSRDDSLHVIAIDRPEPVELWALDAGSVSPTMWNNDWDGSPLVLDDRLVEGGENSQFHIVRLNRAYGADGLVTVDPALEFHAPGWDARLLDDLGDRNVSIESSVAVHDGVAYFTNSGGLVQGWDLDRHEQVFRFWSGDDTDATIVIDADGYLYVASEYERGNARSEAVGQLLKLDPRRPDDPVVWAVHDTEHRPGGFWATPALHDGVVIAPDDSGSVRGFDAATGDELWAFELPGPTWQSPVVVDDVLLQGDCDGVLHAFDVSDPRVRPAELWSVELGGCIESTPAVWEGRIFVGTRAGRFHAIGDPA